MSSHLWTSHFPPAPSRQQSFTLSTMSVNVSELIMGTNKLDLQDKDDPESSVDSEDEIEPPFLQKATKEELLLARAQKRAQMKAEKHAKAEVFKRMVRLVSRPFPCGKIMP